jgi:signal transduction histidine kinase
LADDASPAAPPAMHKLLARQVRRHFGTAGPPPELDAFLRAVSASYEEADVDRRLVERSLELTSQELLQRNAALRERDVERTQFINNAAHELGTPLTPIRLQLHLLQSRLGPQAPPEQAKPIEILERNFERLSRLVRDLLDSARLQASMLKVHLQPLDLREVVYQAVETYLAPAREAGVLIDVEDFPHLPITADPSRLGQVFDNLLSNAVKFTPAGSRVHVAAHVEGTTAVITVRDEGAGMRPEDLQRLFRPFTQVHDTLQITRGGTGLGLYVCKGIVEAMGGTVAAHSEGLGKGSTFTVRLPMTSA